MLGPSPRGGIALFRGSRALAFIQGRDFVIPDDVKSLLIPALSHRLRITAEAEMENVTPEAIINQVATEVPVPKEEAVSEAEETGKAAGEDTEVPMAAAEADRGVSDVSQQTVVESPLPTETEEASDEAQDVSGQADEALTRVEEPPGKMTYDWKWVVIICALVVGIVMLFVGLLFIR